MAYKLHPWKDHPVGCWSRESLCLCSPLLAFVPFYRVVLILNDKVQRGECGFRTQQEPGASTARPAAIGLQPGGEAAERACGPS